MSASSQHTPIPKPTTTSGIATARPTYSKMCTGEVMCEPGLYSSGWKRAKAGAATMSF